MQERTRPPKHSQKLSVVAAGRSDRADKQAAKKASRQGDKFINQSDVGAEFDRAREAALQPSGYALISRLSAV